VRLDPQLVVALTRRTACSAREMQRYQRTPLERVGRFLRRLLAIQQETHKALVVGNEIYGNVLLGNLQFRSNPRQVGPATVRSLHQLHTPFFRTQDTGGHELTKDFRPELGRHLALKHAAFAGSR